MRKGWEYKSFETCINKLPKPKQVKTSEYSSGTKYPIISQEDKLISGYYDDESYVFHIDSPVVIFGDHTRVLKYVDFDFVVGADGVKIISPKRELNAKFLLYYLQWYKIPNLGYSRHYKLLKEIKIPLPPKSTQLAIVSELDKINELIRLKKEQLKDFDNLAQSLFYEMFGDPVENEKGWEVKKLGEVCTFSQGMQVPIENQKEIQNEGDVRFLRIIDFTQGKDAPRYVECDNDKYILHEKEIAIVRYGTPGFVCTGKIGAIANNLFKLNPLSDNIFVFEYLVHWLSTDAFQLSIRDKKYGAALQAIKFSTIHSLEIIIPPLSLQRLFAQRIEQIEREKSEVQKSIQNLETLLASRMQYWFE